MNNNIGQNNRFLTYFGVIFNLCTQKASEMKKMKQKAKDKKEKRRI